MNPTTGDRLNLNGEQFEIVLELLESERDRLLVEIRHTDHRTFREKLQHRLTVVEQLVDRCRTA
jgi:hypothetical protein